MANFLTSRLFLLACLCLTVHGSGISTKFGNLGSQGSFLPVSTSSSNENQMVFITQPASMTQSWRQLGDNQDEAEDENVRVLNLNFKVPQQLRNGKVFAIVNKRNTKGGLFDSLKYVNKESVGMEPGARTIVATDKSGDKVLWKALVSNGK